MDSEYTKHRKNTLHVAEMDELDRFRTTRVFTEYAKKVTMQSA